MFTKSRITTQVAHIVDETTGNTVCGVTPSDRWVQVETSEKVCDRCSELVEMARTQPEAQKSWDEAMSPFTSITIEINSNPEVEAVAIPPQEVDFSDIPEGGVEPLTDASYDGVGVRSSDGHLYEMTETEREILDGIREWQETVAEIPSLVGKWYQSKKGRYTFEVVAENVAKDPVEVTLRWEGEFRYTRTITMKALVKGYIEIEPSPIAVDWPIHVEEAK